MRTLRPAIVAGIASLLMAIAPPHIQAQSQSASQSDNRPRILTREQYYCLVKHADSLEVSQRGTVFDLEQCPPEPRLGAFPPTLSARFISLKPEDVACLKRGRESGHGIAYRRENGRVALYLRPCGRN